MDRQELDAFLREVTPREQYYLDNPGAPSPRYQNMEHRRMGGKDVLYFQLAQLKEAEVLIRKDSRFTDVPYYVHSNVNLQYIYSGKCEFLVDDRCVTLRQGDVALFDVDVVRRKQFAGENDIVINLSMSRDFFSDSFLCRVGRQSVLSNFFLHVMSSDTVAHDHYLIFRSGQQPSISVLFEQLLLEYYSERQYRKEMIQGYLRLIFVELMRLYDMDSGSQLVQLYSGQSRKVLEMFKFLENNVAECTLGMLADTFGYHPKYVSNLLRQVTGYSFKQLQNRQRMSEAARLLLQTEEPVYEVARKVGMANLTSFYHSFESRYGMLPNAYRQQNRSAAGK